MVPGTASALNSVREDWKRNGFARAVNSKVPEYSPLTEVAPAIFSARTSLPRPESSKSPPIFETLMEPPRLDSIFAAPPIPSMVTSPRPLSISIQMKDPFGAVLCGDTILLKYDPRNAPGIAVAEPGPKATKAEQAIATRNQIEQGINLARLEGQELDRENGKNLFQDDVAPNGQVTSISAQGTLPCTKKQFDNIA